MNTLTEKRQYFHRQLIALGEEQYKSIIVEATFPGIVSTMTLTEEQMDILIHDADDRLSKRSKANRTALSRPIADTEIRKLRNKVLIALAERGIKATTKDWSQINNELAAPRYQWILNEDEKEKGHINRRGLAAFNTTKALRKLFYQICAIRDNELKTRGKNY